MRVLRVAREQGVRVPDDLAVIGFDDLDVAEYLDLTTVRQPLDESGQTAVELLLEHVAAPSRSLKNIELKLSIVERETA
jgi:LacI family transcriptional regulator